MGKLKVVIEQGVEAKRPTFGELSPGDVFMHDVDLCIKLESWIDTVNIAWHDADDGIWLSGHLDDDDEVQPVEAELRISKPAAAPEAKPLTFGDLAVGDRFRFVGDGTFEGTGPDSGGMRAPMSKLATAQYCYEGGCVDEDGDSWGAMKHWLVERV